MAGNRNGFAKRTVFVRLLLLLSVLLFAAVAAGQQNVVPAYRVESPPVIDGVVDSAEWTGVPSVQGGYDENTGEAPPFKQQFWLAYDEKFIYMAAVLEDPQPSQIRATEYRTNVSVRGDDFVLMAIDPFGTLNDSNQFEINPRGANQIRIAGGRAAKREWLGEIFTKGRITETGYEVEARIPWALMRLPGAGQRDVRVTFGRVIARTGRAYLTDNLSSGGDSNFGIWKDVLIPRVDTRPSLRLLPYGYIGGSEDEGLIANSGLDFKAPINSGLDLVGSINPDFRNIENQVLSIDFSYFERLAGESRPFFLEGADYFGTSQDSPLFVSQRIRDFDFGGKTYGKLGDSTTVGVLNTSDFGNQNAFVSNVRHNLSPTSSFRVAVADLRREGLTNTGSFVSYSHGSGPLSFFGQHMTTDDTLAGAGHRYNAGLTYSQGGAFVWTEYVEISPEFLPRLGFAPERDFKGFTGGVGYTRPVDWGRVIEAGFNVNASDFKTMDGDPYRKRVGGDASVTLRDGTDIDLFASYSEFLGFKDQLYGIQIEKPRGDPYRHWAIDYQTGHLAGHSYRSIRPSVSYRPLYNLQLNASYQRVDHFDLREQTILSANYDLNMSDAISGRLVREGKDTNFYLAFRRTGNKGAEYYLILGDPNARSFRASIVLKVAVPFEWKF